MGMPVVDIGIVRMGVFQPFVSMRMGMRFAARIVGWVFMSVMFVVSMPVFVLHWFMHVRVLMSFRDV